MLHLGHLVLQMRHQGLLLELVQMLLDQMKDQMLNLLLVRRIHHLVLPVLLLGHLLDRLLLDQIHQID